ncbi:MAG: hypothetical protein RIB60_04120 [Phycisphaerales bacterium]
MSHEIRLSDEEWDEISSILHRFRRAQKNVAGNAKPRRAWRPSRAGGAAVVASLLAFAFVAAVYPPVPVFQRGVAVSVVFALFIGVLVLQFGVRHHFGSGVQHHAVVRAMRRVNRCASCGYLMRHLSICPECGATWRNKERLPRKGSRSEACQD